MPTSLFGWTVVNKDDLPASTTKPAQGPSSIAPTGPSPIQGLRSAYASYLTDAFGDCSDAVCQAKKEKIWKGAIFAVHAAAALDGLKQGNEDVQFLVGKLRDFLPGVSSWVGFG